MRVSGRRLYKGWVCWPAFWRRASQALSSSRAPTPDSRTRDCTPTIIATVRDEPTGLTKDDLRFYLDGVARGAFSHEAGTDRLSYTSGKLSYARHTVKVVARDAAGNVAVRTWRFEVVR